MSDQHQIGSISVGFNLLFDQLRAELAKGVQIAEGYAKEFAVPLQTFKVKVVNDTADSTTKPLSAMSTLLNKLQAYANDPINIHVNVTTSGDRVVAKIDSIKSSLSNMGGTVNFKVNDTDAVQQLNALKKDAEKPITYKGKVEMDKSAVVDKIKDIKDAKATITLDDTAAKEKLAEWKKDAGKAFKYEFQINIKDNGALEQLKAINAERDKLAKAKITVGKIEFVEEAATKRTTRKPTLDANPGKIDLVGAEDARIRATLDHAIQTIRLAGQSPNLRNGKLADGTLEPLGISSTERQYARLKSQVEATKVVMANLKEEVKAGVFSESQLAPLLHYVDKIHSKFSDMQYSVQKSRATEEGKSGIHSGSYAPQQRDDKAQIDRNIAALERQRRFAVPEDVLGQVALSSTTRKMAELMAVVPAAERQMARLNKDGFDPAQLERYEKYVHSLKAALSDMMATQEKSVISAAQSSLKSSRVQNNRDINAQVKEEWQSGKVDRDDQAARARKKLKDFDDALKASEKAKELRAQLPEAERKANEALNREAKAYGQARRNLASKDTDVELAERRHVLRGEREAERAPAVPHDEVVRAREAREKADRENEDAKRNFDRALKARTEIKKMREQLPILEEKANTALNRETRAYGKAREGGISADRNVDVAEYRLKRAQERAQEREALRQAVLVNAPEAAPGTVPSKTAFRRFDDALKASERAKELRAQLPEAERKANEAENRIAREYGRNRRTLEDRNRDVEVAEHRVGRVQERINRPAEPLHPSMTPEARAQEEAARAESKDAHRNWSARLASSVQDRLKATKDAITATRTGLKDLARETNAHITLAEQGGGNAIPALRSHLDKLVESKRNVTTDQPGHAKSTEMIQDEIDKYSQKLKSANKAVTQAAQVENNKQITNRREALKELVLNERDAAERRVAAGISVANSKRGQLVALQMLKDDPQYAGDTKAQRIIKEAERTTRKEMSNAYRDEQAQATRTVTNAHREEKERIDQIVAAEKLRASEAIRAGGDVIAINERMRQSFINLAATVDQSNVGANNKMLREIAAVNGKLPSTTETRRQGALAQRDEYKNWASQEMAKGPIAGGTREQHRIDVHAAHLEGLQQIQSGLDPNRDRVAYQELANAINTVRDRLLSATTAAEKANAAMADKGAQRHLSELGQILERNIIGWKEWAREQVAAGRSVKEVYSEVRAELKKMADAIPHTDLKHQNQIAKAQLSTHSSEQSALMAQRTNGLYQMGIPAAVAGALGGALRSSAADAVEFDKNLHNVNSIAQMTSNELGELKESIIDLTRSDKYITEGPAKLTAALYDIYSSGFSGKEALEALALAAKGATAGLSDTKTAVLVLTGTANAYNSKTGPEMQHIMDVLFRTVDKGVVTFPQLASSIGPLVAIAAQYKIPLEDLGAGIATMTIQGIKADVAITDLKNLITHMATPSEKMSVIAKSIGLNWLDAANAANHIKEVGLPEAIKEISDAASKHHVQLGELFGDVRPQTAIAALTTQNGELMNKMVIAHRNAAGAQNDALEQQVQSVDFQLKRLSSAWDLIKDSFAQPLMLPGALSALSAFIQEASKHEILIACAGGIAAITTALAALTSAIAMVGFAKTIADISALGFASKALGATLAVLASPWTLLSAVVAAATAVVIIYRQEQELASASARADIRVIEKQKLTVEELLKQHELQVEKLKKLESQSKDTKEEHDKLRNIQNELIKISDVFGDAIDKDGRAFNRNMKASDLYTASLNEQLEIKRLIAGAGTPELAVEQAGELLLQRNRAKADYDDQKAVSLGTMSATKAGGRYEQRHNGEQISDALQDLAKRLVTGQTAQQQASIRAEALFKIWQDKEKAYREVKSYVDNDKLPDRMAKANITHAEWAGMPQKFKAAIAQLLKEFPNRKATSVSGGVHAPGSGHGKFRAIDFGVGFADDEEFAARAKDLGLALIDERSAAVRKITGGIGPHFHLSDMPGEYNSGLGGASSRTSDKAPGGHQTSGADLKRESNSDIAELLNTPDAELKGFKNTLVLRKRLKTALDAGEITMDGGQITINPDIRQDLKDKLAKEIFNLRAAMLQEGVKAAMRKKREDHEAMMAAMTAAQAELAEFEEKRMAGLLGDRADTFSKVMEEVNRVRNKYGAILGDKGRTMFANVTKKYDSEFGEQAFKKEIETIDQTIADKELTEGTRLEMMLAVRNKDKTLTYRKHMSEAIGKQRIKLSADNNKFLSKSPEQIEKLEAEGTLNALDKAQYERNSEVTKANHVYNDQVTNSSAELLPYQGLNDMFAKQMEALSKELDLAVREPFINSAKIAVLQDKMQRLTDRNATNIKKYDDAVVRVNKQMTAALEINGREIENADRKLDQAQKDIARAFEKIVRDQGLMIAKNEANRAGIFANKFKLIDQEAINAGIDLLTDAEKKDETGQFGKKDDPNRQKKKQEFVDQGMKLIRDGQLKSYTEAKVDYINMGATAFIAVLDKIGKKFEEIGDSRAAASVANFKEFAGIATNVGRLIAGDPTALIPLLGTAVDKLGAVMASSMGMLSGKMSPVLGLAQIEDTIAPLHIVESFATDIGAAIWNAVNLPKPFGQKVMGDTEVRQNHLALGAADQAGYTERTMTDILQQSGVNMSLTEIAKAEQQLAEQRMETIRKSLALVSKGSAEEFAIKEYLAEATQNLYKKQLDSIRAEEFSRVTDAENARSGSIFDSAASKLDESDKEVYLSPEYKALQNLKGKMTDNGAGSANWDFAQQTNFMGYRDAVQKAQPGIDKLQANTQARLQLPVTQAETMKSIMSAVKDVGQMSTSEMTDLTLGVDQAKIDKIKKQILAPGADGLALRDELVAAVTALNEHKNKAYSDSTTGKREAYGDYTSAVLSGDTSYATRKKMDKQQAVMNIGFAQEDMKLAQESNNLAEFTKAEASYYQSIAEYHKVFYEQWKEYIDQTSSSLRAQNDTILEQVTVTELQNSRKGLNVTAVDAKTKLQATQDQRLAEARALKAKMQDDSLSAQQKTEMEAQLHKMQIDYLDEENKVRQDYQDRWIANVEKMADATRQGIKDLYESGAIMKSEMDSRLLDSQVKEGAQLSGLLAYDNTLAPDDKRRMTKDQRIATEHQYNTIVAEYVKDRGTNFAETPHVAKLAWDQAIAGITVNLTEYKDITGLATSSAESTWNDSLANITSAFGSLPAAAMSAFSSLNNIAANAMRSLSYTVNSTINSMAGQWEAFGSSAQTAITQAHDITTAATTAALAMDPNVNPSAVVGYNVPSTGLGYAASFAAIQSAASSTNMAPSQVSQYVTNGAPATNTAAQSAIAAYHASIAAASYTPVNTSWINNSTPTASNPSPVGSMIGGSSAPGSGSTPFSQTVSGVTSYYNNSGQTTDSSGNVTGNAAGGIIGYADGGFSGQVLGFGNKDSELSMLTPGEFVIPTRGTEGMTLLQSLRSLASLVTGGNSQQAGNSGPTIQMAFDIRDNTFAKREDIDYIVDRAKKELGRDTAWVVRSH